MVRIHFILYVKDQLKSTSFYTTLLALEPTLNVPGMTEFELPGGSILGLMPENGIAKIISGPLPHPSMANGAPRCELYLLEKDFGAVYERANKAGARSINKAKDRDWGHRVAYFADPDGHVIAVACELGN